MGTLITLVGVFFAVRVALALIGGKPVRDIVLNTMLAVGVLGGVRHIAPRLEAWHTGDIGPDGQTVGFLDLATTVGMVIAVLMLVRYLIKELL